MRLWFLVFGIFCCHLWGQETDAPVVIDGKEIFRVYGTVGPFSVAERAEEIQRRITLLAEKKVSDRIAIRSMPADDATAILSGTVLIMAVTATDARATGVARDELATRYGDAIQNAIEGYRTRHTWRSFVRALSKTIVIWMLFAVAVWALWRSIRWFDNRLKEAVVKRTVTSGVLRSSRLIYLRGRQIAIVVLKATASVGFLSAFSFVISYTLSLFPQTAGIV